MAADSDGLGSAGGGGGGGGGSCGVVVTCEGDLRDPRFPARLRRLLRELRTLLAEPHPHTLKVNKVEPWNSVRVTLSVPRAAAARLRALATSGAPQLRALGILSVQLDGDAAVSLRLTHGAELRINTDNTPTPNTDDASTSRSTASTELLAGLGGIGRLLEGAGEASASTSEPRTEPPPTPTRDNFKSPNTVCPMDGKIPQNIPTPTTDRCEFPFGSMTQARVIHRKENTLGLSGQSTVIRAGAAGPSDVPTGMFPRASTSSFPGPPPPYPAPPAQGPAPPPTVAMSSPLLVNLLQNDAPQPQPRAKPPHPAKLDRLDDSQVELAVGRAPFEYRGRATPASPAPGTVGVAPRAASYIRRAPPALYRGAAPNATVVSRPRYYTPQESFPAPPPPPPPPPYRQVRPPPAPPQHHDIHLLPPQPNTPMDQKTQSSYQVQEFQRYQQQYIARQRAAATSRANAAATSTSGAGGTGSGSTTGTEWGEGYRELGAALSELPDACDLDQLLPTLGADLDLDAISDLDAYDQHQPDQLLRDLYSSNSSTSNGPEALPKREETDEAAFMPPPPAPPPAPLRAVPPRAPDPVMPPPQQPPRPAPATATVGSQASAQEIEEQNKQYLIKTLMRDDDGPQAPAPPVSTPVPNSTSVAASDRPQDQATTTMTTTAIATMTSDPSPPPPPPPPPQPEMFGIAKCVPEEDARSGVKLGSRADRPLHHKGGKPRPPAAKPPALHAEKESIKLRLKLDKNEPVVQPVYKADVSFVNQARAPGAAHDKPTDTELRVPPLHISLRGRNSAVIKNSKKEKKKFAPAGELHSKKFKVRKSIEGDEKRDKRDSDESAGSKSGEGATDDTADEFLTANAKVKLNNHYGESDAINEITGVNNVVFRMKTISKNAHIVTKHDYKLNNKVQSIDLKMKKKLKILNEGKPENKEWRNDTLDKEGKYAHNEGYRETANNHDAKNKLPSTKVDNGANCDASLKSDGTTVQSVMDSDSDKCGASELDSRLLKCHKVEWTIGEAGAERRPTPDTDNHLKRTITESAITSPNGLINAEKKRKISHSSCPAITDSPVGSTNVGTIVPNRVESPPPASSQRTAGGGAAAGPAPGGGQSPRRKERPKDKSYCKLVAERADKGGSRSPASHAQGDDSGIESMDALSEKSPNQASQSPPGPARAPRLDMPRSTSPASVQRIIGIAAMPPDRPSLADIEAELAKMHADHRNGDDAPHRPATPILRDPSPPAAGALPPPASTPAPAQPPDTRPLENGVAEEPPPMPGGPPGPTPPEPKLERLPLKADFPDKSLLEQLLIEIPTPEYVKRGGSPSPSALERVARTSVRTRSSSKMNSPAEVSTRARADSPRPATARGGSVDKTSPRAAQAPAKPASAAPAPAAAVQAAPAPQPAKRKRRESESSTASTVSCEEGVSPGRPKKKPRRQDPSLAKPAPAQPPGQPGKVSGKKDSDSDSDEPLICKVRGKAKGGGGGAARAGVPGKPRPELGVGTRRSGRHPPNVAAPAAAAPPHPPPPATQPAPHTPPLNNTPVRRKTRSAVGEGGGGGGGATAGVAGGGAAPVRRRRASRDAK